MTQTPHGGAGMPRQIVPKYRGFTLLEITMAVAIIAILSALLVYGISHLTASAKANQTSANLQNARNILQEFDSAVGLSRDTRHWPWLFFNDSSYPPTPPVLSSDPNSPAGTTAVGTPSAVPATLSVNYWTAP